MYMLSASSTYTAYMFIKNMGNGLFLVVLAVNRLSSQYLLMIIAPLLEMSEKTGIQLRHAQKGRKSFQ